MTQSTPFLRKLNYIKTPSFYHSNTCQEWIVPKKIKFFICVELWCLSHTLHDVLNIILMVGFICNVDCILPNDNGWIRNSARITIKNILVRISCWWFVVWLWIIPLYAAWKSPLEFKDFPMMYPSSVWIRATWVFPVSYTSIPLSVVYVLDAIQRISKNKHELMQLYPCSPINYKEKMMDYILGMIYVMFGIRKVFHHHSLQDCVWVCAVLG